MRSKLQVRCLAGVIAMMSQCWNQEWIFQTPCLRAHPWATRLLPVSEDKTPWLGHIGQNASIALSLESDHQSIFCWWNSNETKNVYNKPSNCTSHHLSYTQHHAIMAQSCQANQPVLNCWDCWGIWNSLLALGRKQIGPGHCRITSSAPSSPGASFQKESAISARLKPHKRTAGWETTNINNSTRNLPKVTSVKKVSHIKKDLHAMSLGNCSFHVSGKRTHAVRPVRQFPEDELALLEQRRPSWEKLSAKLWHSPRHTSLCDMHDTILQNNRFCYYVQSCWIKICQQLEPNGQSRVWSNFTQ